MKNKKFKFEFSLLEINAKYGLYSVMKSLIIPRQVSILGTVIRESSFRNENDLYYSYCSEPVTDYRIFVQ